MPHLPAGTPRWKTMWSGGVVAVVALASVAAHAGTIANGAMSNLSNGASRDMSNGASTHYSNGASAKYSNGASVTFPNGASMALTNGASISLSNGASTSFSNGASISLTNGAAVSFPNGASVTYPNGAGAAYNGASTNYANGASANYANGASVSFPNGASMTFPNGASMSFPNGASVTMTNGATLSFPNGASVTFPNGASVTYPNGGTARVGSYGAQAFLTSHLWHWPLRIGSLHPTLWTQSYRGTPDTYLYQYLVGALKKRNGDLPAGSYYAGNLTGDSSYTGEYDPYDLIAFKYLIRSAANSSTVFTLSYTRADGTVVSEDYPGGLGLCQTGAADDWISTNATNTLSPACDRWLSAAVGLFTQPTGINNSISIRNVAVGDHPAITAASQITTNPSAALALMSLIQPLPRKRGVPLNSNSATDNRALESMTMTGTNSGTYSATNNTQGGWAGGYAFRCTGGSPVVLNLNKLKTDSATIPGTSVKRKNADLVLRVCKGVHGCNKTDADWVTDNDNYSGSDVWPQTSFTCGTGFAEVASANYSHYNFVYNWLVRSKNGDNATANGIATLCSPSSGTESVCRSTIANPTAVTANTVPASETQIYTQHEGLFFGDSLPVGEYLGNIPSQLARLGTTFAMGSFRAFNSSLSPVLTDMSTNCDVRSVEPVDFGVGLPEPTNVTWTPPAASFPWGASWPTTYRALAYQPVPSDRDLYKREYCSSQRTDTCIPCAQGQGSPTTSTAGYLPATYGDAFYWYPTDYTVEPWLAVVRDPAWPEEPQYGSEAVPVESGYYNATRVCSQQYDRTNQGYCFTDWQDASTCSVVGGAFTCTSRHYRNTVGAQLATNDVLSIWLPQPIQPVSAANKGQCPAGYAFGKQAGYTSRCFKPQVSGASCAVNDECTSLVCNATLTCK